LEREEALSLYQTYPFENHPLWVGILSGELSKEQVLKAEIQHYLRSEIGKTFREQAVISARHLNRELYDCLLMTVNEECFGDGGGPSHAQLIKNFLTINGVTETDIADAVQTPGNVAAIAIYKDIAARGPLQHIVGAGCVEFFYSKLCPKIFDVYENKYGFISGSFETYKIHGPMDEIHGERALDMLALPLAKHMKKELFLAIRDAFVATSLHYDGMYQAATGLQTYWSGK